MMVFHTTDENEAEIRAMAEHHAARIRAVMKNFCELYLYILLYILLTELYLYHKLHSSRSLYAGRFFYRST